MELKVNIGYEQLLTLVKQLPAAKIAQLKVELSEGLIEEKAKAEKLDFKKLLLSGPVMSAKQHEAFLENRKQFNQWRTK